ncbi:Retrovirus-related Pol polyprotein from transposon TNT 1-94 [Vitis vinifera]|uniref:Retrovirus-related Pol polyprotein from transposon TNT 1-94 n=1 Tax=Vitis vinifera TaxID=29760 RepID=A0A438DDB8_VITVI|nr:Retrovirus-related Pol polyprotein from transposon TNT 1-94 [Vitis vinifera]
MKIEVIHLEVAELDEEEQEEEMEEVGGRFSYGRKFTNEEGSSFSKYCKFKNNQQASCAEEKEADENMFYACQSAVEQKNNVWFLDSGCTNHMTGNKNIFLDMDTTINSQVKMGNGDLVNVKGKGTVGIQTKVGTKYIRDVLLVPTLEQNLLSVGQLVEHGRFGHLNFNSLKMLCQRKMVQGLPNTIEEKNEEYDGCALGKHHRQSFPKGVAWRAKKVLELVHTDICGPMSTPSQGNNKYFVLFIDDFTRMTWVFFMKQKSEVFSIFKKFKSFVEKQSGCYIKTLRSDRGMEYTSSQFGNFCEDEGVERQLTVAYTPQQNGVVERKNQTVMEMAKAMLYEKGLPKIFWAEAVNTAVYLLNRGPTKALLNKTPIEAWREENHLLDTSKCLGAYVIHKFQRKEGAKWMKQVKSASSWVIVHSQRVIALVETGNGSTSTSSPQESPRSVPLSPSIESPTSSSIVEPQSFEEAIKDEDWRKAMEKEIDVIEKNETWQLVEKPKDKEIIGVKWIFRVKYHSDGRVQRLKARLVAKGYSQQPNVDFHETFAPVARLDTIRNYYYMAAQKGWLLYQLDIKSAFLNGKLEEEIYVEQPQGFVVDGEENKVYKLKKALYGLKQAPRAWYTQIDSYFIENGFIRSKSEPTLYVKSKDNSQILMCCSLC